MTIKNLVVINAIISILLCIALGAVLAERNRYFIENSQCMEILRLYYSKIGT